ncbi:MAG: restriction endonuclease subunit S [Faecousia sp.]
MAIYRELVKKIPIPPDKKTKQKEYLAKGRLPIIDQGQRLVGGYTNDMNMQLACPLPAIVFGDHTRAVKYVDFPFGAGADGIKVLEPKEGIYPKYLFYATQYLVLRLEDKGYARHYQHLEKKKIDIPSVNEQKRIVARIEELFSGLDNGVETLRKTKQQLAMYRQAVISAAFPEMTEENTVSLNTIAEISGGITKGRDLSKHETIHLPYLRVANVQNGFLDLSEMKTIELKKDEIGKYLLQSGDVLYTEGGDRDKLGRGTVWNNEIPNCVHQNHIFKARLDRKRAIPEYVAYWSMSAFARNYFFSKGKQSVNLASINKTILSALPLPLPNLMTQEDVLHEIESRLSVCDEIDKTVDTALQQAEAMRQSILKQAFEGKL